MKTILINLFCFILGGIISVIGIYVLMFLAAVINGNFAGFSF